MKTREYDLWADGYGGAVHLLDDKDEYPVAGYAELLAEVYEMVRRPMQRRYLMQDLEPEF